MNKLIESFFELRGSLNKRTSTIIAISGLVLLIGLWQLITSLGWVNSSLLPSPLAVISSLKELHFEDALVMNTWYSIKLNFLGYIEAIFICIPVGFLLGLFPLFREMFRNYLNALRFVPLTAVTGLFIAWFGIENTMKIQFLAFGIAVYLLPTIVQRIQEVDDVYVQTIKTLSTKRRHAVRKVFIPAVLSKISDDIRVLVAISWTYIIVAELVNRSGGIGSIAFLAARQSRIDKVYAVLAIIILIGFIQDKLFIWLDRIFFPHKYQGGQNE